MASLWFVWHTPRTANPHAAHAGVGTRAGGRREWNTFCVGSDTNSPCIPTSRDTWIWMDPTLTHTCDDHILSRATTRAATPHSALTLRSMSDSFLGAAKRRSIGFLRTPSTLAHNTLLPAELVDALAFDDEGTHLLERDELRAQREAEMYVEWSGEPTICFKEYEPLSSVAQLVHEAGFQPERHLVLSAKLRHCELSVFQHERLHHGRDALFSHLQAAGVDDALECQRIVTALAKASRLGRVTTQLQAPPLRPTRTRPSSGRVAFLFLIYDRIEHEALWEAFFATARPGQYSIHVHAKTRRVPLTPFFERHHIPRGEVVPTAYAEISLVHAHTRLLATALCEPENTIFVFVSGACIPVKPFGQVHTALVADKASRFSAMFLDERDAELHAKLVCKGAHATPGIRPSEALKASQWCVLHRTLAEQCVAMPPPYIHAFASISAPEEWYFRTTAHVLLREGVLTCAEVCETATNGPRTNHHGPTFVNWHESTGSHPRCYGELDDPITIDELHGLVHGPCLFARKFARGCRGLAPLLEMLRSDANVAVDG